MKNTSQSQVAATASAPQKSDRVSRERGARFELPRVRRLGALPVVTAAFGGSFTP